MHLNFEPLSLAFGIELVPTYDPECLIYSLYIPYDGERAVRSGTNDHDYLSGTEAHEEVHGFQGDDTFAGSAGSDLLSGGMGVDTVDYWDSPCAVTVDLNRGYGMGGHAHRDEYRSIENVIGSAYSDTLIGSGADNVLKGGRGDDRIEGRAGDDHLIGGTGSGSYSGDDTLLGAAGNDTLYGSGGDNELTGGAGQDVFRFLFIDSTTTITDFQPGVDTIELVGFFDFEHFLDTVEDIAGDVVFARENNFLGYVSTLIIENTALSDLSATDFIFN